MFIFILEDHVKCRCHTLPTTSIHSFEQLVKEIREAFDMYAYKDVYKMINQLRMKTHESLEDSLDWFLHLCYEFSEEYVNWNFMSERFQHLVLVSLK